MYYKTQFMKQTHSDIIRPSNLLPVDKQVFNRKLWPSSLRHFCNGFRSYCKQIFSSVLIWHGNNCITFLSIIQIQKTFDSLVLPKKWQLSGLLTILRFCFVKEHHWEIEFQNISILHNDSNISNLVWLGMKHHLSCLMWKLLMWNHVFPTTLNYDPF